MKEIFETSHILFPESEHGLIGFGEIRYRLDRVSETLEIYTNYNHHKKDNKPFKILTGNSARVVYAEMQKPKENTLLTDDEIAAIGLLATRVDMIDATNKTRKQEVVFARYLIMWGLKEYLKYSLAKSGAYFNLDHATALHGNNIINEKAKYLSDDQLFMKKSFKKRVAYEANKKKRDYT